jgi:hypothetical protein
MSRVQLSINVSDFEAAVEFYSRLFSTGPAKLRPGYANFILDDPPLKLVLNSPGNGPGGTINHLGIEVSSTEDVTQTETRPAAGGLAIEPEPGGSAVMRGRIRCGPTTPTEWRGSTTRSWNTSKRHDLLAALPCCVR